MAPRLVACPSCSQHVKLDESHCLHCGARLRSDAGTINRTAGAMLMGLSLTACPSDDSTETMGSGAESSTGGPGTMSTTMGNTDPTGSTTDMSTTGEAEYGVPETGDDTTTSNSGSDSTSLSGSDSSSGSGSESSSGGMTESDTDSTGSIDDTGLDTGKMTSSSTDPVTTGIEPLYGVMTTGVEPEYGVATTGIEPDYGVGEVGP